MKLKYLWVSVLIVCLIVTSVNVIKATDNMENIITITVDSFDKPGDWVTKFSRFRSKNFVGDPTQPYEDNSQWIRWISFQGAEGLEGNVHIPENFVKEDVLPDGIVKDTSLEDEKAILAIKSRWDFKGHNWIIIEPANPRVAKDGIEEKFSLIMDLETKKPLKNMSRDYKYHPNFIWLSGKTKELFVYVWGCNADYYLECHIEDHLGNVHELPFGSLNYKGWKNLSCKIPHYISQTQESIPQVQPIKFLRFKVYSDIKAIPDNFYIYLDYLHASVDIYSEPYFGQSLEDFQKIWNTGSSGSNVVDNEN